MYYSEIDQIDRMYSSTFAQYYDILMGDYSSISDTTKQLVTTYLPEHASILELGCGTGNMLKVLSPQYRLTGLDNSSAMLAIAHQKVPSATLIKEDMTSFRLSTTFDGIICIFDTINHLSPFSKWKKLFSRTSSHLNNGGIFIFDMNTKRRLDRLSATEAYVGKLNKETLLRMKITNKGSQNYIHSFHIYENICSENVKYAEETVEESAYPTEKVIHALSDSFTIEKMVDPIRKRITSNTGRIFFVCRKK